MLTFFTRIVKFSHSSVETVKLEMPELERIVNVLEYGKFRAIQELKHKYCRTLYEYSRRSGIRPGGVQVGATLLTIS